MRITCGEDLNGASTAPGWHYWFYLVLPSGEYVRVLPEMVEDSPDRILADLGLLEPRRSEARELLLEGARLARTNHAVHNDSIHAQAEVSYERDIRQRWGVFGFFAPTFQAARSFYSGPGHMEDKVVLTVIPAIMVVSGILILIKWMLSLFA